MDVLKHRTTVAKARSANLHGRLLNLVRYSKMIRLEANSAVQWSVRLQRDSDKLDELLNRLFKAS